MAQLLSESATGYAKYQGSDGSIFYKDPAGKFTNQNAYAGSKMQERYTQQRDPETGRIRGNKSKRETEFFEQAEERLWWRSTLISDEQTTHTDWGKETNVRIEAYTVTEEEHPIELTWTAYNKAVDAFWEWIKTAEQWWDIDLDNPNREGPRQINPGEAKEVNGTGQRAFFVFNGTEHEVDL